MQQNVPGLKVQDDKKQHVTINDSKLVGASIHKLVQFRANFPARFQQTPSLVFLELNIEPVWITTMKGFSIIVLLTFMAIVLHTGVTAAPYFEDKGTRLIVKILAHHMISPCHLQHFAH